MSQVITIGMDIAKNVFHAHGVDARGGMVFSRKLTRSKLLDFFATHSRCVVAFEACGDARHEAQTRAANRQRQQDEMTKTAKAKKKSAVAENGSFQMNEMNEARNDELTDERRAARGPASMDRNYREPTKETDQTAPIAQSPKRPRIAHPGLI